MRLFSLSAVGRCLRQPRHTPLIILPLNTQPLAARTHVYGVGVHAEHVSLRA